MNLSVRTEARALYGLAALGLFEIGRGVVAFGVPGLASRVDPAPGVVHPFLLHLLVMLVYGFAALLALRDDVSFAALFALLGSMFASGPINYGGGLPLEIGAFLGAVLFVVAYRVPWPWAGLPGAVTRLAAASLAALAVVQVLAPESVASPLRGVTLAGALCGIVAFASRAALHRDRRAVGLAACWLPIGLDSVADVLGFGRLAPVWFLHGCLIVGPVWVGYVYLTSTEGDSDAGQQASGGAPT